MQLFTSSNLAKKLPLNIASNGKWYQALLWLLGYVVIELAQYTFATFPFSQNYLQLGTGYLFAVLLLLPGNIKIIFGIASYSLGVLLSINFGHHNALATGVAYSIIFVQMLTGVWAIHRIKNFNINRPKHAVQFMALGFFLPAVASSIVHAIFVSAQTLQDVINCIAFSIAPAISILIVVPLFFATVTSKLSDRVQQVWLKALWFCVLVALTVGIFGILNNEGPDLPRYSVFLFPLIMYSSYQYSFRFNTLVMLILFTIATWLDGYSGHVSLYNGQQSVVMVAVYFDIAQSIMLLIGAFRSKNEWNDQSIAKNDQLNRVARIYLREGSGVGNIRECREPSGASLLNKDAGGRCCPLGAWRGLLANLLNEALQALKVALGNAIEWIKGEGCLVLLLRAGEVALLPEALGETVLCLDAILNLDGVAEGEDCCVRLARIFPTSFGGGLQRDVGLLLGGAARLLGGWGLVGEGHGRLLNTVHAG